MQFRLLLIFIIMPVFSCNEKEKSQSQDSGNESLALSDAVSVEMATVKGDIAFTTQMPHFLYASVKNEEKRVLKYVRISELGHFEFAIARSSKRYQFEFWTENKKEIYGVNIDFVPNVESLDIGKNFLKKLSAIVGKVSLNMSQDRAGIFVYIPSLNVATRSDKNGEFVLLVEPGAYDLVFEQYRYSRQVVENVIVQSEQTTSLSNTELSQTGKDEVAIMQLGGYDFSKESKVKFLFSWANYKKATIEELNSKNMKSKLIENTKVYEYNFSQEGEFYLKFSFLKDDGSEGAHVYKYIFIDTQKPSAKDIKLVDAVRLSADSTSYKKLIVLGKTCDDISKVAIIEGDIQNPKESDFKWPCFLEGDNPGLDVYTAAQDSGDFSYTLWSRDQAGNISRDHISSRLKINKDAVISPNFSIYDSNTKSTTFTNSYEVLVSISNCDHISKIYFNENKENIPDASDFEKSCNSQGSPYSYKIKTKGDGEKRIYLWAMDDQGKVSTDYSTSTINLTREVLSGAPDFTIESFGKKGTRRYVNQSEQVIFLSSCEGISQILISEKNEKPDEFDSDWRECGTYPIDYHLDSEGNHKISIWGKDQAGNVSKKPSMHEVTLDTVPPIAPNFSLASDKQNDTETVFKVESCDDIAMLYFGDREQKPTVDQFDLRCEPVLRVGKKFTPPYYLWAMDASENISENPSSP